MKEEQQVFANAAKIIDPKKQPIDVFKEIQNEHPKPDELIPDVAKDLDQIRQYVLDHQIVTIPSDVRAHGHGDAAVRSRDDFRLDGYARTVREKSDASVLLRHASRGRPGREKQKNEWLTSFNYLHDRCRPPFTRPIPDITCSSCT